MWKAMDMFQYDASRYSKAIIAEKEINWVPIAYMGRTGNAVTLFSAIQPCT